MSVSMWSYRPEVCDGGGCPGDCDLCDKPKIMPEFEKCNSDGKKMVEKCDYISRQAAIDTFHAYAPGIPWDKLDAIFDEVPSADVMPKTKEAAIDYLHDIGWMQEHDKEMTADVVEVDKAQKEIDYWHDKAQSYEQTILKLSLNKADVVEVVRCKDCKHNWCTTWNHGERDNPDCKYTKYVRDNDFYCSFGEREEA